MEQPMQACSGHASTTRSGPSASPLVEIVAARQEIGEPLVRRTQL
jgi:hypothetical protein